ncbi:MAG: DUF4384 domain-containing protein [Thermoanaerobaculia bacterium]|nr:DUF4384 domain-containing protein [Thermoanaerobaculia bacterium]
MIRQTVPLVLLPALLGLPGCRRQESTPPPVPAVEEVPAPVAQNPVLTATVYRLEGGKSIRTSPAGYTFRTGEKIRVGVTAPQAGYFYIAARGSSGSLTVLFPNRSTRGGSNRIEAGEEVIVPAQGSFEFSGPSGEEVIYAVYSTQPTSDVLTSLQAVLATGGAGTQGSGAGPGSAPVQEPQGAASSPQGSASQSVLNQLNSRGRDFVLPSAGAPQPATPDQTAVSSQQQQSAQDPVVPVGPSGVTVGILRLRHG